MARPHNKLTAKFIQRDLKPGLYGDGGGLALQVSAFKTKAWVFRFMIAGQARKMGFGAVGNISLASARELAADARKLLQQGVDPIARRDDARGALAAQSAKAMTFRECAVDYITTHQHKWKSAKHRDQWSSSLEQFAFPMIGALPVGKIDHTHVVKTLSPIWKTKGETARRVRSRIELVLERGAALDLRSGDNPARLTGRLKELLGPQVRIVEHHSALPYQRLPAFMGELRQRESVSARALEFTILTACRTGDTIGAKWDEIDLKERTWTIPKDRLKAKLGQRQRDHVVPLSDRAVTILRNLPREADFVFPGARKGRGLSKGALIVVATGLAADVTVHGFRSAFKDWCSEQTAFPNELSELALAHTISDRVEAAYRRGDMREKRRQMMESWSRYCASVPRGDAKVVPLRSK